ncbi:lipopolysaccharide biosynthesis protein [Chloroflexota bacterium]
MFLIKLIAFIKETYTDAFRLTRHPRESINSLYGISLYRNAGYLMANAWITAVMGIVFWIIAARLYSEEDVGFGSALISAGMLLSLLGNLGLGFGIIRFLPDSKDKARLLNSSLTICLFASIVAAFIFLIGFPLWLPKLRFVLENLLYSAAFVIFIAAGALNTILAQTLVAFRRTGFSLIRSLIFNISRLVFIIAFATVFKSFGIFASWGIAMVISAFVYLFLFLPQVLPGYRSFLLKPNEQVKLKKETLHFSFVNYSGQALQSAPTWILPLMVLDFKSAEANAHFYITFTMANVLLAISAMTSMSLFAEGSNVEERLATDLRKSLKLILSLLIPAVLIILLLGDKLLLLFGREYSEEGTHLLWLLALSSIPASINYLYLGISRVEKKLKTIIVITGILALGTLISSYLLLLRLDIFGVGVGWLATQSIVALVVAPKLRKRLKLSFKGI